MPYYPMVSAPLLGEGVQINVELEDNGLWFDAEQRYNLRYGIG